MSVFVWGTIAEQLFPNKVVSAQLTSDGAAYRFAEVAKRSIRLPVRKDYLWPGARFKLATLRLLHVKTAKNRAIGALNGHLGRRSFAKKLVY